MAEASSFAGSAVLVQTKGFADVLDPADAAHPFDRNAFAGCATSSDVHTVHKEVETSVLLMIQALCHDLHYIYGRYLIYPTVAMKQPVRPTD